MVNARALMPGPPVASPTPVGRRVAEHVLGRLDRVEAWPLLLVLMPVGSLVVAGLLGIALSRISGAPVPVPTHSFARAGSEVQADVSVIDAHEPGGTMIRFGPMVTR